MPTFSLSRWVKWTIDNYYFFNLVKGNLVYNPVWFITFEKTKHYFQHHNIKTPVYKLRRLKDISTPDFSTQSCNPRLFNHELFNLRLFNHKLFSELFNRELLLHELWGWKVKGWNVLQPTRVRTFFPDFSTPSSFNPTVHSSIHDWKVHGENVSMWLKNPGLEAWG